MHDIHDRPDGSKSNIKRRIECPNIPPEEWCDYRRDYEFGLSLECIAEKYCCDPRTARDAIIKNKSSSDIGKKTTPRKITGYTKEIDRLIKMYCRDHNLSMLIHNLRLLLRDNVISEADLDGFSAGLKSALSEHQPNILSRN